VDSLRDHIATLKGENEALKADLSQRDAQMEAERARANKAIAAFASLADRLDQLAAERSRPWWRRWARTA
jgi:hypothetical protein